MIQMWFEAFFGQVLGDWVLAVMFIWLGAATIVATVLLCQKLFPDCNCEKCE